MLSTLRLYPEDALTDYARWHRLLRTHAIIFLLNFSMFALAYYLLDFLVEQPNYFQYLEEKLSHYFVIIVFAQVAVLIGFNWHIARQAIAGFLYQPSSPYNLAIARLAIMGSLSGHLLVYAPENLAQVAALPESARVGLPLMSWFIDMIPISPGIYSAMTLIGGILCLFAALGFQTRWSILLSIPFVFYALGVPNFFGKLNHSHFMLWAPIFLAFAPVGEVWSIDALFRRYQGKSIHTAAHYRYGVAMKLIFLQLGLIYFFSAIGKLWSGGLHWPLSDNLVYLMQLEWLENYGDVPAIRLDKFPILCRFLSSGVIAFELAYVFLIFSPKIRPMVGLAALGFHTMTGYFLNIDFAFLKILNTLHLDIYKGMRKMFSRRQWWWSILLAIPTFWVLNYFSHIFGIMTLLLWSLFTLQIWIPGKQRPSGPLPEFPFSKWVMRVGFSLLAINFCFGLAQESSWPFSTYPSYSFVRTGIVKYIWFKPITPDGKVLDLNALGQAAGFRKENILPIAEQGVNFWEKKQYSQFEAHVLNYWLRFREKVPALKTSQETKVIFQVLSTNPDRMESPLQENEIGNLRLVNGTWEWQLN